MRCTAALHRLLNPTYRIESDFRSLSRQRRWSNLVDSVQCVCMQGPPGGTVHAQMKGSQGLSLRSTNVIHRVPPAASSQGLSLCITNIVHKAPPAVSPQSRALDSHKLSHKLVANPVTNPVTNPITNHPSWTFRTLCIINNKF